MKSNFLSLSATDFLKGLFVAIGTALLTGLYDLLQKGASFDWPTLKPVVLASVAAGIAYLIKNLFTNSQNQLMVSEKNATPEIVKPLNQ
jgi:drug/metabolite transporter (DMT)-like permease